MTIFIIIVIWLLLGILGLARANSFDKTILKEYTLTKKEIIILIISGLVSIVVGIVFYTKDQKLFDFKFKR